MATDARMPDKHDADWKQSAAIVEAVYRRVRTGQTANAHKTNPLHN